jgi:hypothetical protein
MPSATTGEKNDLDHMILLTYLWIIVFTDVKNWVWSEAEIGFQRRRGIVSGLAIHEMCIHYFPGGPGICKEW